MYSEPLNNYKHEFFNSSQIFFSDLDNVNFLPHSTVTAIEQDHLGFIWFGTQAGIVKFDGNVSKKYDFSSHHEEYGVSNWIHSIFSDSEGRIWVGSGSSLSLYLPEKDEFTHFNLSKLANSPHINEANVIIDITEDNSSNIWFLSTKVGPVIFNHENSSFSFLNDKTLNKEKTHNFSSIATDERGGVYITSRTSGLYYKPFNSDVFRNFNSNSVENWPSDSLKSVLYSSSGVLWIGSNNNGLFSFDIDNKEVFIPKVNSSVSANRCVGKIVDLLEANDKKIWMATYNGLCSYDPKSQRFYLHEKNNYAKSTLKNNQIHSLKQDEGGVIWIGTQSGINYWNAEFPSFQHINKQTYPIIQSEHTISFAEDKNGNFYIGSFGGGITQFYNSGHVDQYDILDKVDVIIASIIPALFVDDKNHLWIGTLKHGLYVADLDSGDYKHYVLDKKFRRTSTDDILDEHSGKVSGSISKIKALDDGSIVISTWGEGVFISTGEDQFLHLAHNQLADIKISSDYILDIQQDEYGFLWIATHHGGLERLDLDTLKITSFHNDPSNPQSLQSESVYGLLETEDYIWMTTPDAGIARLDKERLKNGEAVFQHFGAAEGLGSDFTYGILQDDNGYIWVSHSKGLTRFNPYTLRSINFNTSHGLQGVDFNSGAFFKSKDGRMFFGGANGFNTFLPNQVPINTYQPPIRLTQFSQSNQQRPIHELFKEDGVLELPYDETVIDFEFAALDFTEPSNNQYKYKMEGLADIWIDLGTNNHIPFSHLDDGTYTLKVKGSNNDGVWSEELAIPIRVLPPLWRTWYAYLTYFILLSALFLMYVRQQQIKIQSQITQERKLHKLAYFDNLTGLPNRQSFYESMEKFLSLAKRGNYNAGVMFIDLDRFKRINDTLGHNFGDKVLMEVAERLRLSVRNSDFVARNYDVKSFKNEIARLGGDEFTVFLSHIDNPEETSIVTQRIIDSISQPIVVDGYEVSVTPSIGIALYPENGNTVQELMKHADVAMYQAKEDGRRTFKYFSNELNDKAFERLQLEEHLRTALKNHEFELYYQPQVDLFNNRISKAEALIRWHHPKLGFVSPADFIPIAEESGLIVELGEWILQTACFQAKEWLDQGMTDIKVSINVSSVQFKQTNLVENVQNALSLSNLPSECLELELTESAVMSDVEDNIERLQQLKNMGVTIAVDDFGTGYSSLSYLKKFPIDTLKIDRSFIMEIDKSENDAAIVKAIMLLAETMQLNVVAEGIETIEQLKIMDSYGCKYIQGYFFSRPLPATDFIEFINSEFKDKQTWKLEILG